MTPEPVEIAEDLREPIPIEYSGLYMAAKNGMAVIDVWSEECGWQISTIDLADMIERASKAEAEVRRLQSANPQGTSRP